VIEKNVTGEFYFFIKIRKKVWEGLILLCFWKKIKRTFLS